MGLGKFQFSMDDIKRIGRDSAFAGIGACALYFLGQVSTMDFGLFNSLVAAIIPVGINAVNRWLRDNNVKE